MSLSFINISLNLCAYQSNLSLNLGLCHPRPRIPLLSSVAGKSSSYTQISLQVTINKKLKKVNQRNESAFMSLNALFNVIKCILLEF